MKLKHTSVTIAAGGTVTIPKSADLVNAISKYLFGDGYYYGYNATGRYWSGYHTNSNLIVTVTNSSYYTLTNEANNSVILYYSYWE